MMLVMFESAITTQAPAGRGVAATFVALGYSRDSLRQLLRRGRTDGCR